MADNINPTGNKNLSQNFLPNYFRTDANKKFLQATIEQLIQPGTVKKVHGYIGRENAKSAVKSDVFVNAPSKMRQDYQLEPSFVVSDSLDNVTFFKDYQDYINQLSVFGSNVSNHSRLNSQEFYSWDPHINWDKFVNFQNYYWLPNGPDVIKVYGQADNIVSTYTVKVKNNGDNNTYVFTPNGLTENPVLTLYRGQTYNFNVDSIGNPFSIKTERVQSGYDLVEKPIESGVLTVTLPYDCPDVIYYQSTSDIDLGGVIHVLNVTESSSIDVTNEVIGKQYYTTTTGVEFSNGMKISFGGRITPTFYANKTFYVEGVGTAIQLVNEMDLELVSQYTTAESMLFDTVPFDKQPFSEATSYAGVPDYIVIDRSSIDKNPWSRYNRWFHKSVIEQSATLNGSIADLDQTYRAVRPIIEFESSLKLANFGTVAVDDVDLIDTYTTDVFSTIEGSAGYNIDGIDLVHGHKIIFTADTDVLVKNKMFQVEIVDVIHATQTNALTVSVTATTMVGNTMTVSSTANMEVGQPIRFSGTTFGNVVADKTYYILTILDETTIKISSSIQGNVFPQVDAVGIMSAKSVYETNTRQLHLVEILSPTLNDVALIHQGVENQGVSYWFNGSAWKKTQQKTKLNQTPLFDIFDENQESYSNLSVYSGSTFTGTKIFSYKIGTGTNDSVLNFPLAYKTINNTGDILFNFDLVSDSFEYEELSAIKSKQTSIGFLLKTHYTGETEFVNGWQKNNSNYIQPAVRIYKNFENLNNFKLDLYDDLTNLDDLVIKVYVNGIRLDSSLWDLTTTTTTDEINPTPIKKELVLTNDLDTNDVLTIKAFAKQAINSNGHYEIPINLQNNPKNGTIKDFTLGEVIDHVSTIVDTVEVKFNGAFPGISNLRDLGNVTQYGTRFVQHSGPASLSLYHITSETNNIVRALEKSREDYNIFKKNFLAVAASLGVDTDTRTHVNLILSEINKNTPTTSPYYFSDMAPYSANRASSFKVVDFRNKYYPLTTVFNLDELSNKAVGVYLNGIQLLYSRDYIFDPQGFIVMISDFKNDDVIDIYEYESTDGCFIPETPTKLGIWPKYTPKIYLDTSYVTPQMMIQGHDGSQILAYGDYRDDLILELEKRIYNNIKVEYDTSIFDINEIIPSYNRETEYSIDEFNQVLAPTFYKWLSLIDRDFTKPLSYDSSNSFTFNYRGHYTPDNKNITPGYWRGIYRWLLDSDRPNIAPWEMLGFSEEPLWWTSVYGTAPYTSDNLVLWSDISNGYIKEPNKPVVKLEKFAKPFILDKLPVDEFGYLRSPLDSGLAEGIITGLVETDFVFGDVSPVESAWRRSSYYPFSVLIASILLTPSKTFGVLLDRSRVVRNLTGQLVYKDTGLRITPADIKLPSIYSSETRVQTSGIINYLVNYILSDNLKSYAQYKYDLKNISSRLSYRLGSFTSKEKFHLLLDSKSPTSTGSIFVPQENYKIIVNSSSPIQKITYSGVIVTKLQTGFEIKGYDRTSPFFTYYDHAPFSTGISITVGGISESYSTWEPNQKYYEKKIVLFDRKFYQVNVTHTSEDLFEPKYYTTLPSLPVVGGVKALFKRQWDKSRKAVVPYGTVLETTQEVVDFLLGYGEYLVDQGFVFDKFNQTLAQVANWETSAKEFMFWTTQNWSSGQDKWDEWNTTKSVSFGSIIRYNGDYYRAIRSIPPSSSFDYDAYVKLEGLSSVGSSVISLSPAAAKVSFNTQLSVVDDILNPFNGYQIFRVDGTPIPDNFLNSYREDNSVSYIPIAEDGIYGASFFLVQYEHVAILDNTTMFNDTIYSPETGYKQDKIKVSGYVSSNWNGSFNIPGFIFDQAKIREWQPWTFYALGDTVKYKQYYYSALSSVMGAESFNPIEWTKLDKKPESKMLPNWSYKASQFTDFYDLDSDNFDTGQQKMAQHLIGYQKRQYLENIIQDDVSEFKFYQGMITEKGTQNVLNKLFDVLSADDAESIEFYEEWALRSGQYGASSAFETIEFVLDESLFKNNPQGFELVDSKDSETTDFIIRQTPNEIYLKPLGYVSNPWPAASSDKRILRSAGYVRTDEVLLSLTTIDDIVDYTVDMFTDGDYVWCSFETFRWNVYRYTNSYIKVVDIVGDGDQLTITTDSLVTIKEGSYIGIDQTTELNGFYKVVSIELNKIIVDAPGKSVSEFFEQESIIIYNFTSQRAASVNTINNILPKKLKENELVWTDNTGKGANATWVYSPVYNKNTVINFDPKANLNYGKDLALNSAGTLLAMTTSVGKTLVVDKATPVDDWIQRQVILPPAISQSPDGESFNDLSTIASVVAMSQDGAWLATGSPDVGNVVSRFTGTYDRNLEYLELSVVELNSTFYRALAAVPTFTSPDTNLSYWEEIPYISVDLDGSPSSLFNQGVISLYKKDSNNIFSLVDTILSPSPESGERFGSSIAFGDNELFVTASGSEKIYNIVYRESIVTSAFYNPNGSEGTILKVSNTEKVEAGMTVSGTGFNSNQLVVGVVDSVTLIISDIPNSQPSGTIKFLSVGWKYNTSSTITRQSILEDETNGLFGKDIVISKDFLTMLISSPTEDGAVFVYKKISDTYILTYTLFESKLYPNYGQGIAVSDNGEFIAVSDVSAKNEFLLEGVVHIYQMTTDGVSIFYTSVQTLNNKHAESSQKFGTKIYFTNDSNTLVVFSAGADSSTPLTIDDNTTTFDNNSTAFVSKHVDSGRIDIFDRYDTSWVYSESLDTNNSEIDGYGYAIAVSNNLIVVGAPYASVSTELNTVSKAGEVYYYVKPANALSWTVKHTVVDKPDVYKIKQAFLYNRITNELITYLDVIDPAQGKFPGVADQEIRYKSFFDPAVYSVGDSTVNVDDGTEWLAQQVGSLWWDLRTVKFINSYDNDVVYRNSVWNTLATGASVDVYEWVETTLLPSEWDAEADTEIGLSLGISGLSLYGDTAYSVRRRYDNISRMFKNTYYFWVKNKKTIPDVVGRSISANTVSNLIANPRGEGYQYLALTGLNSFSLVNVKNLIKSTDVVLSVEYWTIDSNEQNIHTQWKLINNDVSTTLPTLIEQKWVDSLCGKDAVGREVPDLNLPVKIRYGIENRPIQSMFVNRFEALKQIIEQTNRVFLKNLICDTRDISPLYSVDQEPNEIRGLYDVVKDSDAELKFERLKLFQKPSLSPIIVDGRITGVTINSAGRGYKIAPFIEVVGTGVGAVLRTILDSLGRVVDYEVISSGYGYTDNTTLFVRSYSVLVHNDSQSNGTWSIYSFDKDTQVWSKTISQTYDVTRYWKYVDWYATGVSQFSSVKHAVDTYGELVTVTANIGDLVKIRTNNAGNWLLLRKYSNSTSYDWTQSYEIVGSQNGTIQLSSLLYDFSNTIVGFDGLLYDGGIFDNSAATELRIILNTIKDNIFVDDLKNEYLNLFFTSVRYALSEQTYLDWIFKTSFVKARHNVGKLKQLVTYRNDNLQNFEDYVAEVKPYRTQVREYTSAYTNTDLSSTAISDFDLPPISTGEVISANVTNDTFSISNPEIQSYPWKFWLDNVGFSIIAIKIVDGGAGYVNRPVVRIVGKCGTTATGTAFIANGKVTRILITNPGKGYLSAPTIVIDGGIAEDGTSARAVAIIGDSLVRSNLIKMKFDRHTNKTVVAQLEEVETFVGNSMKVQFPLIWGPDVRIGYSSVTIDGIDVLRDTYVLQIVKTVVSGETKYSGTVTFETAPKLNSIITVNYRKDWSLLSAADRIEYYYTPESGSIGKDLSQLITGVDYGGVIVTGLGFEISGGWGNSLYSAESWDNYDSEFDDYIVTVSEGTHEFELPYTPLAQTELNVYQSKNSYTSFVSDGQTVSYSYDYSLTDTQVYITKLVNIADPNSILKNVAGSKLLYVTDTSDLQIGDVVTDETNYGSVGRVIISGTNKDTNILSVTNSSKLRTDMPIYIYGPSLGGVVEGIYYILEVISLTEITISQTLGGAEYNVIKTETGIQTIIYGVFNYNTYVTEIISLHEVRLNQPIYSNVEAGTGIKFTRRLEKFNGIYSITPGTIRLSTPAPVNWVVEILGILEEIRLDDPNYGTSEQTNANAIMSSIVADGITNIVTIPGTYQVNDGDKFIIRKSTSDGSKAPNDTEYDTSLSGGDLDYLTASGIAAEDIIVDGDGFVTPTSSPATEEVVPGQVVDAVAIKVFDKSPNISSNIAVENFVSNGSDLTYDISMKLNSSQSVIIKVLDGTTSTFLVNGADYTVDVRNNQVSLIDAPIEGAIITVFAFGYNGFGLLDSTSIVSNGVETLYVSSASFIATAGVLVYVDGISTDAVISEVDGSVAFEFAEAPLVDSLITYFVTDVQDQTVSITKTERINANGSNSYALTNLVGTSLPYETSMIVRVDDMIIPGPSSSYFTIEKNRLNYQLDSSKVQPYSVNISDIIVSVNGVALTSGTDYTIDLGGVTVKINKKAYKLYTGQELAVTIKNGYTYSEVSSVPTITFSNNYDAPSVIEVISSYNHTSLNIRRSTVEILDNSIEYYNYAGDYSNILNLDRTVIFEKYVWISKNGKLLTPDVEYVLNPDKVTVTLLDDRTLTDVFEVITFGSNFENQTVSYMQFKDMLNRVHYKRLNANKVTKLTKALRYNDLTIEVEDASILETPKVDKNRPGIIEIRGERIEFFEINGNVLTRLRRGTLGTGCPEVHNVDSLVQDLGVSETLPYNDITITSQVISDGTNIVDIDFVPTKVAGNWTFDSTFETSIPQFFDQTNDVEVFVGGYNDSAVWTTDTAYQINDIVSVGMYMYRCVVDHTSGLTTFKDDMSNWKFFVGNIRLKKTPYKVHDVNQNPYSPAGDVQFDADFSVDGYSKQIRLTNVLDAGTLVTVIKRTGKDWDTTVSIRDDETKVARFVKGAPGSWYSIIKQ